MSMEHNNPAEIRPKGLRGKISQVKRHVIQLLAAVLYNLNFQGIASASIYTGASKKLCVPGLNCYSCPGAIGACPLGALQSALATPQRGLPFYVIGLILAFGALFGRTICGWACPFGFIQDLLDKIPTPKLRKNRMTRRATYLKYIILAVFVLILPPVLYWVGGVGSPAFCSWLCPAGTLEGGIPLLLGNEGMRIMMGPHFWWKVAVLVAILGVCLFVYRPFCRFLCPLGALYSFFNRFALLRWTVDENTCTHCGTCMTLCPMDIREISDRECIQCGRCAKACPAGAVQFSLKTLIAKNGTLPVDITNPESH